MQQRLKAVLQVFSLPAGFLPTGVAVISADVLVILIVNMNGMQASKARSGTAGRVISSFELRPRPLSSRHSLQSSGTLFCHAKWVPMRYVQAALPAVSSMSFICWLHHTELGPLRRAAAFCAVLRCAMLCCAGCATLCCVEFSFLNFSWAVLCCAE